MRTFLFISFFLLSSCLLSRAASIWDDYWYKDMSGIAPTAIPGNVSHGQLLEIECTETALNNAVGTLNNSISGGTIRFKHNNVKQTIFLNQSIKFVGNNKIFFIDGQGFITIDGQNKTGMFEANDYVKLIFQNITLAHGRGVSGSGLNLENRVGLIAINVTFTDNHNKGTADINGGGAVKMNKRSYACFANCKFINNSAWTGGAIGATHQETLIVLDSEFKDNRSIGLWDGISYPSIWETGGVVTGITGGGAIRCDNLFNICEVYRSTFDHNSATVNASALEVYVNQNHEWRDGINRPSCVVDSCMFRNNGLDTNSNEFTANTKYTYEGVIQHFYGGKIVIINSAFVNNQAANGTLVIPDSRAIIFNCLLANNRIVPHAFGLSAGLYTKNSGLGYAISIDRTTFYKNQGATSGALLTSEKRIDDISITNSLFVFNTSTSATQTNNFTCSGTNNIQWPATQNSQDLPITSGVNFKNPLIVSIDETGYPPKVLLESNSPALNIGSDSYITTNAFQEKSYQPFLIYPNPADDYLIIRSPHTGYISKIKIIGMNGEVLKLLRNASGTENKVSLQGLAKGTYLIQIEGNNQQTTGKFFKN